MRVLNLTLLSFATLSKCHVSVHGGVRTGEVGARNVRWRANPNGMHWNIPLVGFFRGRVGTSLGLRVEELCAVSRLLSVPEFDPGGEMVTYLMESILRR